MPGWVSRLLEAVLPKPFPRAETPRLPETVAEAERVYRYHDSLNGRYYFLADLVLENGAYYRDVVFDGDTRIAVCIDRRPLHEQPELVGKAITALLITRDRRGGCTDPKITEEDRRRFAQTHKP